MMANLAGITTRISVIGICDGKFGWDNKDFSHRNM